MILSLWLISFGSFIVYNFNNCFGIIFIIGEYGCCCLFKWCGGGISVENWLRFGVVRRRYFCCRKYCEMNLRRRISRDLV